MTGSTRPPVPGSAADGDLRHLARLRNRTAPGASTQRGPVQLSRRIP